MSRTEPNGETGPRLYGLRLRLALEEQCRDTCEDYGHHGRERCVVCGIWRDDNGGSDA